MRIIILNVQEPFVQGGAEYLANTLNVKLLEYGHRSTVVKIPFKWYPSQKILEHLLAYRLFNIRVAEPDLVIALKFPAYVIPSNNKKIWLLHQFRQAYDLWGTQYQELPSNPEGERIRNMIQRADDIHLHEAREIYTISKTVAYRLERYNQIRVNDVLYPPLLQPELYQAGDSSDYFFFPSRLVASKRQHIAIEAMRFVKSKFKLVIAGYIDDSPYSNHLKNVIQHYNLSDKVELLGWVSEEEKAKWMSNAFAAVFIPYDEDYGYVTIEAFHANKPVITFVDSGGPTEFVVDGENGLVTEPSAQALAESMERLWANRKMMKRMGEAANLSLHQHKVDWDHVIGNLIK